MLHTWMNRMHVYLHSVHEEIVAAQDLSWQKSSYAGSRYIKHIHKWVKLGHVRQILANLERIYTNTNYNPNHFYTVTYTENLNMQTTLRYATMMICYMSLYTVTNTSHKPTVLSVTVSWISCCVVVCDRV